MKIRRIIIGLQPAPRNRAVLQAAAALAARLEAELLGLFVEDADLLRFAALPFAREVGAAGRALDVEAMERSLRAAATEAREMLASVAGGSALRWSFRVARGAMAAELLAVADNADLVVAACAHSIDSPPSHVRVVRAEDARGLRAALEADGAVVLAGDEALVGEVLRNLLEEARI